MLPGRPAVADLFVVVIVVVVIAAGHLHVSEQERDAHRLARAAGFTSLRFCGSLTPRSGVRVLFRRLSGFAERLAGGETPWTSSGVVLPALEDHIAISGIDF